MERGVAFHENSSNRSRYKEEKTLDSLSKVPYITDLPQPHLERLKLMQSERKV